jgi:WD40 repeat protein
VETLGIQTVVKILAEAEDLAARTLAGALRARMAVLEMAPSQLAPQLLGCLHPDQAPDRLGQLLSEAAVWREGPWLRPLGASQAACDSQHTSPLAASFQAHLNFIGALRVLPDGKQMVSASEDGTIRIWPLSPEGSLPLATLEDHGGPVNDIAVSPDGKMLVSVSDDRTVRLWDLETLDCRLTMAGHTDYVSAVVVTPDGRAASASKDGTIRIWDLSSGACLAVFEGHEAWVNALAVTPDGGLLISASINNRLKSWDLQTLTEGQPFFDFEGAAYSRVLMGDVFFTPSNTGDVGHKSHASVLLVSPDGRTLVSGGEELILWDIETRQQKVRFPAHPTGIQDMTWMEGGKTLVTAAREIKVWDLDARTSEHTYSGHLEEVTSLAASPDGRWLVSGSKDRTLKYWDLSRPIVLNPWQGHSQSVIGVRLSPDEALGVSSANDGQARLWDMHTGQCRQVLEGHSGQFVYLGDFTPDGRAFVTYTSDSEVGVWDLATGQLRHMLVYPERYFHASGFTILPGGRYAVCSGMIHPMAVWDLAEGGAPEILPDTPRHLLDTAVTRDGCYFAAVFFADVQGTSPAFMYEKGTAVRQAPLQWWDFEGRRVVWEVLPEGEPAEAGYFCKVLLTPDEARVVAATSTGWLGLFDVETGQRLVWWRGHPEGYVNSLQLLADGRLLTCGHEETGEDQDGNQKKRYVLRWWDLTGQTNLHTLTLADPDARTPQINAAGTRASFPSGQKECLWDLEQDRVTACFHGTSRILFDAISRDGGTILAGEKGGAVHVLRVVQP